MRTVEAFLEPEEKEIGGKKFLISLIPAIQAQRIYADVIKATDGNGTLGMTMLPKDVAMELLSWCAFECNDKFMVFETSDQINSYLPRLINLIELEVAMIRKNFDFLFDGGLQRVLESPTQAE